MNSKHVLFLLLSAAWSLPLFSADLDPIDEASKKLLGKVYDLRSSVKDIENAIEKGKADPHIVFDVPVNPGDPLSTFKVKHNALSLAIAKEREDILNYMLRLKQVDPYCLLGRNMDSPAERLMRRDPLKFKYIDALVEKYGKEGHRFDCSGSLFINWPIMWADDANKELFLKLIGSWSQDQMRSALKYQDRSKGNTLLHQAIRSYATKRDDEIKKQNAQDMITIIKYYGDGYGIDLRNVKNHSDQTPLDMAQPYPELLQILKPSDTAQGSEK